MATDVTEVTSQLFGGIFTGAIWVMVALLFIMAIGGFAFYIRYRKKFDIMVEVRSERDDGKVSVFYDRAAILRDKKTKHSYLRLLNLRMELPEPGFQYLQRTNKGDLLRLFRKSDNDFTVITDSTVLKDQVVAIDGKIYKKTQEQYKQVEGDVAFWNVKRKQENKGLFDTESILMKLLPFIPHIMGAVISLFIVYILMDSLPGILTQLSSLTSELTKLTTAQATSG